MWKVKLIVTLLSLFIIGTVIFLVLDPGGDIYNQYLNLGQDTKSGFESKKEFNYQSELAEKKNEQGKNNGTAILRSVTYFNQSAAGKVGEFGGWDGNNKVEVGKGAPICIWHSGCGPTSLAEFEAQQGSYAELANPEKMAEFVSTINGIKFGGIETDSDHGGTRIEAPGAADLVKKYAEVQGYDYEVIPSDCWSDESKAKEWWTKHLTDNHWIINLLGSSQGSRGTPIEWKKVGHFVSFYGLEGDKPITWDVGSTEKAGKGYDFSTIWNDSRPISDKSNAYWNTAIWNTNVGNNSGSSSSGGNSNKQTPADGVNKLEASFKFADRTYGYANGAVVDMECYAFKTTATDKKNFTVFVDAGHGSGPYTEKSGEFVFPTDDYIKQVTNKDTGASKDGSLNVGVANESRGDETAFNLDVALKLKELLLTEGYDVLMSRTTGERKLSNGATGIMASKYADILISIHWNGSDGSVNGTCTFYYDDTAGSDSGYVYAGMGSKWGKTSDQMQKSKSLASSISDNLVSQVGFAKYKGGIAPSYYRVLGYSTIPSVLVETGFGDNATDKQLLNKRDEIAKAFLDGVNKYYQNNK